MRTTLVRVTIFCALCATLLPPEISLGQITGAITSDTTWATGTVIADSVYVIAGKTLTIQPGTIVKFNKALVIAGILNANGTLANPITFTANSGSPAPGAWYGIEFQNTANVGSVFNYCVVSYAGGGPNAAAIFYKTGAYAISISNCVVNFSSTNGINVRASSPHIWRSTFDQNAGYGVFSDFLTTFVVDTSCVITHNTAGGIRIAVNATPVIMNSRIDSNGVGIFMDNGARPTITNNYIRGNSIGLQFTAIGSGQPVITADTIVGNIQWGFYNSSTTQTVLAERNYWGSDTGPYSPTNNPTGQGDRVSPLVDFQPWSIQASALTVTNETATIGGNTTWASGVHWVKNSITVNGGITLTINPGVIVKFAPGARLLINGALIANGQANNMIIFTSEKDDSYGGDSNGDGTATGPNPGDWDCVYMNGGGASSFSYCIFKFGGSGGTANLYFVNISPNPVTNIFSTNSSNYGLYLNSSNPTISNSIFGGNGSHGILAQGNSRLQIHKCVFTGNGSWGIDADGGTANATVVSMDSSNVSRNGGGGVYSWYSTGVQTFSYNRVDSNAATGIWTFNVGGPDTVKYLNNVIIGNGQEGIVTSRSSIVSNTIQNNRYPIALLGRVNSTYSGNTITGNAYNNTIALRLNRYEESYSDTLKAVFPSSMSSPVYTFIENAPGWGVVGGNTLVIQPGVIIKMAAGLYWRVEGSLKADASAGSPIVFTSYRDSTYGGKTNLPTDYSLPARGDWDYFRIRTSSSVGTVLKNVIFKFGGYSSGEGTLWIEAQASLTTPVTNVIVRKSYSMGIRTGDSQISFTGITLDSCGAEGMYIEGSSTNGSGVSTGSDITIQNSTITDNGATGLRATSGSAYRQISNCIIRRNGSWGIGVDNGAIQQSISGNTVTNNGGGGIYDYSPSMSTANIQFVGNLVTDHGDEGILSTEARFVDNTIQRNRYPIGVWGRTGNSYVDNNGVDGNIISGNTYNNAISLRGNSAEPLYDTLKNTFPSAITSKTYVAIEDFQVNNGTMLVIQPGVNLKFQRFGGRGPIFNAYGTVLAQGTQANPIVFTSWHDSIAGGKTTTPTDWGIPLPGDIYYVGFRNGSGSSIIRYCQFKFGGGDGQQTVYFDANLGAMVFSNNLIRKSSTSGIYVNNTPITIDSTTVDSCSTYGIYLSGNNASSVTLRNSRVAYNGSYGIWARTSSSFTEMTNCTIIGNGATGAYIENNGNPGVALRVTNSNASNNNGHGFYISALNNTIDTLLLFKNCTVSNNVLAGIFSSRAYLMSDSIFGNRYAVGVLGQLTKDSTGNVFGNVYRTNTVFNNTFKKTLVTEGTIYGTLGGSYLEGDSAKVVAVRGDAFVAGGSTLTITPGTIIKFPREYGNGRLEVQGVLKSEGTSTNKIVFTSWKDDTYGGDSNADSIATVPAPGNWDMIWLNGASNNTSHIFNTIVRYGSSSNNGNIRIDNSSAPVDSSYVSFSSWAGIYLYNSSPAITATEIHHNVNYAVYGDGSSSPVLHLNNIHDNTGGGVFNNTTNTWNATSNFWGAVSGPYKNQGSPQNLTGTGNRIYLNNSGDVNYTPFLTTRTGVLMGDVSLNGTITSYDAALILKHLVAPFLTGSQLSAADVSGDGSVSALDASYILRYVVGLITGFPGLGKTSSSPSLASAYDLRTVRGSTADEIQIVLHLNGTIPLYATELQLAYDSTLVTPMDVRKTQVTDAMMIDFRMNPDTTKIAMAGTMPITQDGDVVVVVFHLKDKAKGLSTVDFKVARLILNETNVTPDVKQVVVSAGLEPALPTTFEVGQNYPNPFNPTTTIQYQLPATSVVTITVYDLLGHEIRSLVSGEQAPGYYRVVWDGRDSHGLQVASSVYFYRIHAVSNDSRTFTTVRKMMLLK
jgi:hypothetical protein